MSELLFGHNPENPLTGTPQPSKKVAWSHPLPLQGPKAVGRLAGATLNDVLLSAVAGALRTYQLERGVEPVDLITMVPVNLRPLDVPSRPSSATTSRSSTSSSPARRRPRSVASPRPSGGWTGSRSRRRPL